MVRRIIVKVASLLEWQMVIKVRWLYLLQGFDVYRGVKVFLIEQQYCELERWRVYSSANMSWDVHTAVYVCWAVHTTVLQEESVILAFRAWGSWTLGFIRTPHECLGSVNKCWIPLRSCGRAAYTLSSLYLDCSSQDWVFTDGVREGISWSCNFR